jgi:hypothetical protein
MDTTLLDVWTAMKDRSTLGGVQCTIVPVVMVLALAPLAGEANGFHGGSRAR